jgi:hypothetical protein
MGDEYARRFQDPGINFSRDAAEILGLRTVGPDAAVYGGARYAYNVHPEDSKRWIVRAGGQVEPSALTGWLQPFLAGDLEWDQDADGARMELSAGAWLPEIGGRRAVRLAIVFLAGASPLGQFSGRRTVQAGLTLRGNL